MIPIIFDYFETAFTSQGLGTLSDCISCTVTEVINGQYECEFTYPVSGQWFDNLVNLRCLIGVEHDHNGDIQPFEVYRYTAPIDGVVTFYAHHISYRLNNVIMGKAADGDPQWFGFNPAQVFAKIPDFALTPCDFTFTDYTDYTIPTDPAKRTMFLADGRASIREAFLDGYRSDSVFFGTEALFKLFPGEFKWDKFNVSYYRHRGSNNGVQIRYGKNMTEVERDRDTGDIVSSVFPFWTTIEQGEGISIPHIKFGDQVYSPNVEVIYSPWENTGNGLFMDDGNGDVYYFGAADRRAIGLDLTDQFETEPTNAQLKQAALDYMAKNRIWKAKDNITVSFADLYNEYEDYKDLEKCSLGDFVDVYYPGIGVTAKDVEIVSTTYDVLTDAFTEMQLGEIKQSYADVILDTIEWRNRT